jgi:hypothetical protein
MENQERWPVRLSVVRVLCNSAGCFVESSERLPDRLYPNRFGTEQRRYNLLIQTGAERG